VFGEPELQDNSCSQMALLSDEQYAAGIEGIRSVLQHSRPEDSPTFKVDIAMMMQCGYVAP
jgi:hypothetical protein